MAYGDLCHARARGAARIAEPCGFTSRPLRSGRPPAALLGFLPGGALRQRCSPPSAPRAGVRRQLTEPNFEGIGFTSRRTRDRLIGRLEASGITDPAVLEVMRQVPRHVFIDEAAHRAYEDSSLPIGHGQTISQPYIVARMTGFSWPGHAAGLEVGSGCGYQTAVLSACGPGMDRGAHRALLTRARRHWSQLKLATSRRALAMALKAGLIEGPSMGFVAAAPQQVPPALLNARPGGVLLPRG